MEITKYTIRTLNSEDFDNLPYRYAREAVGITDRLLKTAFIRDTQDVDFGQRVLVHEIEEMETDKWSHADEFGVRYGFGSWFKKTFIPESKSSKGSMIGTALGMALAPFTMGTSLAFLNPATLGTLGGAVGGYKEGGGVQSTLLGGLKGYGVGSIGTGLNAMAGPATGLKGNVGEFLAGVQAPTKTVGGWLDKGAQSLSNWGTPAAKATGAQIGGPAMGGGNLTFSGGAPSYSIGGSAVPAGNLGMSSSAAQNLMANQMPTAGRMGGGLNLSGLGGGGGNTPLAKAGLQAFNVGTNVGNIGTGLPGQGSLVPSIFNPVPTTSQSGIDWKKIAAGGAVSMAGQAMAPEVEIPTSQYMNQMREAGFAGEGVPGAGQGLTPKTEVGNVAAKSVMESLNTPWAGLPQEYKTALLSDLTYTERDEERALRNEYKRLRPYADIENDSAFRRDFMELQDKQKMRKDNLLAKAEQAEWERFNAQKTQTISQAMGIDAQTFDQYVQLANLDLQDIMFKTGLEYGEAQQFKDIFGEIGGRIMQAGLPSANLGKFNVNLGGM